MRAKIAKIVIYLQTQNFLDIMRFHFLPQGTIFAIYRAVGVKVVCLG